MKTNNDEIMKKNHSIQWSVVGKSHIQIPYWLRLTAGAAASFVLVLLSVRSASADEVYTFESLTVNTSIDGDDGWKDQPGQGDAVVSLDDTGNGTKVVRHYRKVVFDESAFITRRNDAAFNFVSFSGSETNAILQFEASGEHVAMFALGCDRNGDGLLLSADGELGPSFGVYDRNFRVQEVNLGTTYDDGFNQGGGDGNSGNDWYRIQFRMDFTAAGGDGTGSLYFKNLTDHDATFHTVSGMLNRPLGLLSLTPDARPARWNAMWLHLLSNGKSVPCVDNLIPNFNGLQITEVFKDGANLVFSWRGGVGPYQVQHQTGLDAGSWENLGDVTILRSATVPITGTTEFFRVFQPDP